MALPQVISVFTQISMKLHFAFAQKTSHKVYLFFNSLGYSNTPDILYPHPYRCGLSRYERVEMRRCGELIPDWSGEGYWDQGDVVEVLWVGGWDGLPPGAGMMISSVSVGRRFCLFGYLPSRWYLAFLPGILRRPTHLSWLDGPLFLCGGLTRSGLGVWMHPRPEQLASVGHPSHWRQASRDFSCWPL